ncbi:IS30 family transposase [Clostridium perfringens]|uniref:IS30 family transposase n=1 Tax=Clostridium perfringens TaxID=1502 RepID=UPI002AC6FE81|nr:IS30 family transposase [Clostridium perfringens]MDZ4956900.1 IS30 family transposase [Clostridium perfringens]
MDTKNNTTNTKKNKHLTFQERCFIEIRLKDKWSAYKIAKVINRPINTVLNEIRRGTVTQVKFGQKVDRYFANVGERVYNTNRSNCKSKYKLFKCKDFLNFVNEKVSKDKWSLDACFGEALTIGRFQRSEMVCTKTLYSYVDLGFMNVKNSDLPIKVRLNKKKRFTRINKIKLGRSIEERDKSIETKEEFGHWEIDSVIGSKSKKDNVLLTIVERNTLNSIHRKIKSKTAEAVLSEIMQLKSEFGDKFSQVFKTITSDNGLEFSNLSEIEKHSDTKIYFTHPYSSFERGCNERHNGLIRRFIPKGKCISGYDIDEIGYIEDWCNTLPRKKLGYKTPQELFDNQLDLIYST